MSNKTYSKIEIEKKIDNIFSESGIKRRYPIPLIDVANHLGYRVCYFKVNDNNNDVSGAVYYDTRVILINPKDSPGRQSFTIGHEIGHIVLEHDNQKKNRIDYRKNIYQSNEPKEKEANTFSAILLMPESEFKFQWNKLDSDMSKISEYFGVSPIAATFRAKNLKLITDMLL